MKKANPFQNGDQNIFVTSPEMLINVNEFHFISRLRGQNAGVRTLAAPNNTESPFHRYTRSKV